MQRDARGRLEALCDFSLEPSMEPAEHAGAIQRALKGLQTPFARAALLDRMGGVLTRVFAVVCEVRSLLSADRTTQVLDSVLKDHG